MDEFFEICFYRISIDLQLWIHLTGLSQSSLVQKVANLESSTERLLESRPLSILYQTES